MKTPPLLFALCLLLPACRDQHPPAPSIEGRWRQLVGVAGQREYDFRNGVVVQQTIAAGAVVASLQFVYAERGDTVLIGGDEQNAPRTWVVRFLGDGAMEARQLPASSPGIGWYLIFERMD